MDKFKLVDKLRTKTDISYEEAKSVLENNNWDMLEAVVYLEKIGKIKSPEVSEFYTYEYKESYANDYESEDTSEDRESSSSKSKNDFEGIFEAVCKVIDTCNNIFLEIKRNSRVLLKIPLTVVVVLLFFTFWIIIPLAIIGLFFDIEFSIYSKKVDMDKANKVFREISKAIQDIKRKITSHIS